MTDTVLESAMVELCKVLRECDGSAVVHFVREAMPLYTMGRNKKMVAPMGCREIHVTKKDGAIHKIRLWRMEDSV